MRGALVAGSATALALGAAAPAQASVPTDPDGTLHARTSAELQEALALAAPTAGGDPSVRIRLDAAQYTVDTPIVLVGDGADRLIGAGVGQTIIRSAGPLLQLLGDNRADGITWETTATTDQPFSVVQLSGGAAFTDAQVVVPASASAATGVSAVDIGPRIGADIQSAATHAPALDLASATVVGGRIVGGNPTVALSPSGAWWDEPHVNGAEIVAGPQTRTLVQVAATAEDLHPYLISSLLDARAAAAGAVLIDIDGTGPGGGVSQLTAHGLTLVGRPDSIGLRTRPRRDAATVSVFAAALAFVGSSTAVSCDGTVGFTEVSVRAVYRDGAVPPPAAACFSESDRRTGDPRFADAEHGDYRPLWGSSLIDAAPRPPMQSYVGSDLLGHSRGLAAPGVLGLTSDIGAYEFVYTVPTIAVASATPVGADGFDVVAAASDADPAERPTLRCQWSWSSGAGSIVPSGAGGCGARLTLGVGVSEAVAQVTVTDRTGYSASTQFTARRSAPVPGAGGGEPTPTPTPTPSVAPLPQSATASPPAAPSPTPTPLPATNPGPSLVGLRMVASRASAGGRRKTGFGSAGAREASAVVSVRRAVTVRVTIAPARTQAGRRPVSFRRALKAGDHTLRLTRTVGRVRLPRGLYRVTVEDPATGDRLVGRFRIVR